MPSHAIGFVYVLTNPEMPNLAKVGRTRQSIPEDRARDLHTTGVPVGFDIALRLMTSCDDAVENRAHDLLDAYRVAPNREFFRSSPAIAISAIREAASQVSGITAWETPQSHNLRVGDRVTLTLKSGEIFALIAYLDLMSSAASALDIWQAHSDGDVLEIFVTDEAAHVTGLSNNEPGAHIDPVPYLNREGTAPSGKINGKERLFPGDRLLWLSVTDSAAHCTTALFELEAYAQAIGRTWSLKTSVDGFPLLLNTPTMDALPEITVKLLRAALALPFPTTWAPRDRTEPDDWPSIGVSPPLQNFGSLN